LAGAFLSLSIRNLTEALERARQSNRELQAIRASLEERVDERTRDLARRTRYLEATTAIARDVTSVLNLEELLTRVVALISERFGFYHTGIFLLDSTKAWAVLQAASSDGGKQMLARGHRLKVGGQGIVGYVTSQGESRIALDVGADAVYFNNPDLPETRSEVALPLRARGGAGHSDIIGALDVQSTQPAVFSQEDVAVLETLAEQVAMAISNAQLFQQAQEGLDAARKAYGELSRQEWINLLGARPNLGYRYEKQVVTPVGQVVAETEPPDGKLPELTLPVKFRGQTLGTLVAHKGTDASEWAPEEIALMETLTEQLGVALDSARLYQDTQRRAARERLIGQVTGRMRASLDIRTVLVTAADEMRQQLGLEDMMISLTLPEAGRDASRRSSDD
jgi:GAF domain-containing protein